MQNASASSRYFAALLCAVLSLAASASLAAEPSTVSFLRANTISKAGVRPFVFVQQPKRDRTKKELKPAAKAKDDGINLSTVLITGFISFVLGAGGIYFFVSRQKSQAALEQQRLLTRTGTASGFAYTPVQEAAPVASPKMSVREDTPAMPAASVSVAPPPAANASAVGTATANTLSANVSARATPSLRDLDTAASNGNDSGNTDEETIIDPFSTAADADDADLTDASGQLTSPDDLSENPLDDHFLGAVDLPLPASERSALENQYNAARAGEEQYRFAERMIACAIDSHAASVPVFTEARDGIFLVSRTAAEKENMFEMFIAHRVMASGDSTHTDLSSAFRLTRRTGDASAEETYVKPALVIKHAKGWQLEQKGEIIFGI